MLAPTEYWTNERGVSVSWIMTATVTDDRFGAEDRREDIGYYSQSPLAPNLYGVDPDGFLARYRELSGLTEEQLNTEVVQYFLLLGMARLFAQMMAGAGALADGSGKGVMKAFWINSLS